MSLISLFGLYMRLLDSISIVNSRQGIRPCKGERTKLLYRDGIVSRVSVFDHINSDAFFADFPRPPLSIARLPTSNSLFPLTIL